MNSKHRKQLHAKFYEKNQVLIRKVQSENVDYPKQHRTPNAKALVELARTEIGFSCKTFGADIFRSIMWYAKEISNIKPMADKIPIQTFHIENDVVNKQPRLIMTDFNGEEWVLSHQPVCMEGGGMAVIEKKKDCWYFKAENKVK